MAEDVTAEIEIPLAPNAAFALFDEGIGRWWPRAYSWSGERLVEIRMEPRPGGRLSEIGPRGFVCDFGRVTAYERPHRLAFLWQISARREPVPDPDKASTVTLDFKASGEGTRVTLTHSRFENHGEGADDYAAAMGAPQGWPFILECYAKAAG